MLRLLRLKPSGYREVPAKAKNSLREYFGWVFNPSGVQRTAETGAGRGFEGGERGAAKASDWRGRGYRTGTPGETRDPRKLWPAHSHAPLCAPRSHASRPRYPNDHPLDDDARMWTPLSARAGFPGIGTHSVLANQLLRVWVTGTGW